MIRCLFGADLGDGVRRHPMRTLAGFAVALLLGLPGVARASTAPPSVTVAAPSFSATEQVQFSGQVTTFTDSAAVPSSPPAFTITIDWGDGTPTSAGTTNTS